MKKLMLLVMLLIGVSQVAAYHIAEEWRDAGCVIRVDSDSSAHLRELPSVTAASLGLYQNGEISFPFETAEVDGATWYHTIARGDGAPRYGWFRGDVVSPETVVSGSNLSACHNLPEATTEHRLRLVSIQEGSANPTGDKVTVYFTTGIVECTEGVYCRLGQVISGEVPADLGSLNTEACEPEDYTVVIEYVDGEEGYCAD
jgi:hypothetical protein